MLRAGKASISGRRDRADGKTLAREEAIIQILQFIDNTEVDKRQAG
jgi:hypothetical protein